MPALPAPGVISVRKTEISATLADIARNYSHFRARPLGVTAPWAPTVQTMGGHVRHRRGAIFTLCSRLAAAAAASLGMTATAQGAPNALPGGASAPPTSAFAAPAPDELRNFGHDPFLHISMAIADCPAPLGPAMRESDWLANAHHRIEKGNHCWLEGRCRLSNSYRYDAEIAEAAQRRLSSIAAEIPWAAQTSLWLTFERRIIVVQGCVAPSFAVAKFLKALGETADVEAVVDQLVVHRPGTPLPRLTYPTPAHPELPAGAKPLP